MGIAPLERSFPVDVFSSKIFVKMLSFTIFVHQNICFLNMIKLLLTYAPLEANSFWTNRARNLGIAPLERSFSIDVFSSKNFVKMLNFTIFVHQNICFLNIIKLLLTYAPLEANAFLTNRARNMGIAPLERPFSVDVFSSKVFIIMLNLTKSFIRRYAAL